MGAVRVIDDHNDLVNTGTKSHTELEDHIAGIDNYDFPINDGDSGDVLITDGNGNLSWQEPSSGVGFWNHSWATAVDNQEAPTSWTDLDLSSIVGSNYALIILKVKKNGGTVADYFIRPNGDTDDYEVITSHTAGTCAISLASNEVGFLIVETDSSGIIEWKSNKTDYVSLIVVGFIK